MGFVIVVVTAAQLRLGATVDALTSASGLPAECSFNDARARTATLGCGLGETDQRRIYVGKGGGDAASPVGRNDVSRLLRCHALAFHGLRERAVNPAGRALHDHILRGCQTIPEPVVACAAATDDERCRSTQHAADLSALKGTLATLAGLGSASARDRTCGGPGYRAAHQRVGSQASQRTSGGRRSRTASERCSHHSSDSGQSTASKLGGKRCNRPALCELGVLAIDVRQLILIGPLADL